MFTVTTSRITRYAEGGVAHTVQVRRSGPRRWVECGSCGWRAGAQVLAWAKARDHLSGTHDAQGEFA
jgi:hypothetical protein